MFDLRFSMLALLIAAGCASPGNPTSEQAPTPSGEPPEVAGDASSTLVYGDLDAVTLGPKYTFARLSRENGYDGAIRTRLIDGVEFQKIIDRHGESSSSMPGSIGSLVGRPDARFLLIDFEPHPATADEIVYVIPPDEGFDYEGVEWFRRGFVSFWGYEAPTRESHPDLPDAPVPDDEPVEIPTIDVETLRSKMESGDDFVVFISSQGCGNVPPYRAVLQKFSSDERTAGHLFDFPIEVEAEDHDLRSELASELIPRVAFPSLVFIRDGKPVDWQSGGQDYWLIHSAFARNGYLEPVVPWVLDRTAKPDDHDEWRRGVSWTKNMTSSRLDGVDLSGAYFWNGAFAGSSLRDADLSHANLKNVSFAFADLTGANLEGANLAGVHWFGTICPDGRPSEEHGGDCLPKLRYKADLDQALQEFTEKVRNDLSKKGYSGPLSSRIVDGREFWSIADAHGYDGIPHEGLAGLADNATARFLLVETDPGPVVPPAIVGVPVPSAGLAPETLARHRDDPIVIRLGIEQPPVFLNHELTKPSDGDDSDIVADRFIKKLRPQELRSKLAESKGEFLVVISTDSSDCDEAFELALDRLGPDFAERVEIVELTIENPEGWAVAREILRSDSVPIPSLLVFREGTNTDYRHGGVTYGELHNVLARNGWLDAEPTWLLDFGAMKWTGPKTRMRWMRYLAEWHGLDAAIFDGVDLSGASLSRHSFGGASLVGTNFENADLRGANFAFADLTDANLDGAAVDDAIWYGATCPDGRSATENGGQCGAEVREGEGR